jgi:hypothetical protein
MINRSCVLAMECGENVGGRGHARIFLPNYFIFGLLGRLCQYPEPAKIKTQKSVLLPHPVLQPAASPTSLTF